MFDVFELAAAGHAVFWCVGLAVGLALVVCHVLLAAGVYEDGRRYERDEGDLSFTTPAVWALLTAIVGVAAAAAYWAIHRSSLRPTARPRP